MKILQISPQIPYPPSDGGKISIYGITKHLHKRGHSIDFVCYKKNDDPRKAIDVLGKISNLTILDVKTENNIFFALLNLFSSKPYNSSKYIKSELALFLKKYFSNNNIDIVHIDHLHLGWVVDLIRKLSDVPIVLRQQNLEMQIMRRFYENEKNYLQKKFAMIQYKKLYKYEPALCEKFDKCIMISDEDEKKLKELNSTVKSTTISVGVESKLLNYNKKNIISNSLVHIGSMDWLPNYDGLMWYLEYIFPKIIEIKPSVKLFLYGGGKKTKFIIPAHLSENIEIVGFVDDLWSELENKALGIVPLRIGGGVRVKILEMLAVGLNVITTSVGKEGINVYDNEHLLIADDEKSFVDKTISYLNNEYDNLKITKNGKDFISKNHTWEIIAQKFEEEYIELCNK